MLRSRRLWFVLLAGLVLVGGVWWLTWSSALWIRDADRIANGMTREEVTFALCRPADQHQLGGYDVDVWFVMDGMIVVRFSPDGRVINCQATGENVIAWNFRRLRGIFQ